MTSSQLPERPNFEQLKKRAKSLLHAAQVRESSALARFQILPAFARKSPVERAVLSFALHDAQSVIAREHGFPSWTALREAVEERTLTFDAAAEALVRFAVGGADQRAHRVLGLHPGIARASLPAALVLGDAAQVEARLRAEPAIATAKIGPDGWEPLQFVCQSTFYRGDSAGAERLADTAKALLARGANPNAEYHWQWHPELPRTVLWGALCTVGSLSLARVLLEAGANPTDGVCLQILGSGNHIAALDLLRAHGVNVDGIPGGVPPLRYVLPYARTREGIHWLLQHGANPNLAWGELSDAPIHIAAQRWDVALVKGLVEHGADIHARRKDGRTALSIAELSANRDVADWLRAQGAVDELTPVERFVAACAQGDRTRADDLSKSHPALRSLLQPEHHLLLSGAAERGDLAALRTMLEFGFDPSTKDHDRVSPLHRAAMAGRPESVAVLLEHGASPNDLDGMFSASALIWAVQGSTHPEPGSNHAAVARLLIDAGTDEWKPAVDTPHVEGTLERLAELRQAAAELGQP
ncbi:MAG TPA: ankyrin repeat domain-containing protein [Opitutaceae bacterium]|jgi:ankyrin repeat protein